MQIFPFFHNLAILLFSEIVSSNLVCDHTHDKQIGLQLYSHLSFSVF